MDRDVLMSSLKEFTMDKYLAYPKFLFYTDCSYVASLLKVSMGEQFNIYEG